MSRRRSPGSRLRVALIAHLSEVSGAGTALLEVAAGLNRDRFETLFVLPGNGPLGERAESRGIHSHVVPNIEESTVAAGTMREIGLSWSRVLYVIRMAAFLRKQRVDLAYVNSSYSVFAGIAARIAGVPVVWHVHEVIESPGPGTRMKMRIIEKVSRGILYASQTGRKAFPAPSVQLQMVVRNFVDVEKLAATEPLRKQEWGEAELITANGLFPRKGTDLFLIAADFVAREFPGARFLVIGQAPPHIPGFEEDMREMADSEGLRGRVIFAGLQNNLPAVIKASDVFVSASRNEALPIALIEAMAVGTPVVATSVGDCPVLLDNGRTGCLVPPGQPEALAEAIIDLLRAPEHGRKLAAMAREKIRQDYGGDSFWKPLEDFLEAAVS